MTQSCPEDGPAATRRPYHPFRCEYIKRLGVDFTDDEIDRPTAWNTRIGVMPSDGPAHFQIYALTDELRFNWNVTSERRATRVRVRTAPGSYPVHAAARYVERNGRPEWEVRLSRRTPRDRKAIVTFTYTCTQPRAAYARTFDLEIPGTGGD